VKIFLRLGLLLSGLLALAAFSISLYRAWSLYRRSPGEDAPLRFHYALYLPDNRNSFFSGIIEGAERAASEVNAAISIHSAAAEKNELEMAPYSGVDGVIVSPYLDDELARRQLEKLRRAKIPTVLINHNLQSAEPWTFIGANNYDLGRRIGYFVGTLGAEEPLRIAVAYSEKAPGIYAERELVEMGISAALGQRLSRPVAGFKTNLNPLDAEALLYRLFKTGDDALPQNAGPPYNVIVLTDPSDTIAAAQTLVDMNLVGRVRLVGFGADAGVVDNIRKEIISFSVVINSERIGYEAVRSLTSLRTTGFSSTSIDAGIDIITGNSLRGQ
jgi:ribose transport system substrate-binding protein